MTLSKGLTDKKGNSEYMYSLVELWLHTDRTQRSICEEHQIKPHTFNYWRSKYGKEKGKSEKAESGFVSLQVNNELGQDQGYYVQIAYKDGTCLRFGQTVDIEVLKSLLPL